VEERSTPWKERHKGKSYSIASDEQEARAACEDRLVKGESDSAKHIVGESPAVYVSLLQLQKDRGGRHRGRKKEKEGLTDLCSSGGTEKRLQRGCVCQVW